MSPIYFDAPNGGDSVNFKSMSIDKLVKLKDQVETALSSKVAETKRMLESKLTKLTGFGVGSTPGRRGAVRSKVAPKYRNPDNPSETWAGRGLKPRWLAAALKAGKKLEYFSIASTGKKATKEDAQNEDESCPQGRHEKDPQTARRSASRAYVNPCGRRVSAILPGDRMCRAR
jgi:DNA-binding protein H-NS